jgi:hypothetical protein
MVIYNIFRTTTTVLITFNSEFNFFLKVLFVYISSVFILFYKDDIVGSCNAINV